MAHSIRTCGLTLAAALILAGGAGAAFAQDAKPDAKDGASKDGGGEKLRDLCTDRPTKSNGACTVDKGHWQLESDILNTAILRANGVTTTTTLFTSPTIKYGLTDSSDIQLNFTPEELVRVTDHATGVSNSQWGAGDVYLRYKLGLVTQGDFTASLFPYVKAPTARSGIGNGAWEGGLIVPLNQNLAHNWQVAVDPEGDWVHNATGSGYHLAVQSPLTFTHPLGQGLTGSLELWTLTDFDPAHTTHQYSADVAGTWQLNSNLQLDGGLNFGLNRATPGFQGYIGISRRF